MECPVNFKEDGYGRRAIRTIPCFFHERGTSVVFEGGGLKCK